MPKGAVLHAHDTALVSADWIFWNVTFRPNLYVCESPKGILKLRFFDKPNKDCPWKLLSKVRKNKRIASTINSRIYKQMTMLTNNPDVDYKDVDKAWSKFIQIFAFITPMLSYKPVYEDHYYEALKDLYMDNIMYVEIRSTLPNLYELNGTVHSSLETAMVYKKTTERLIS